MATMNTSLSLPLNTLGQHSLCGRHEVGCGRFGRVVLFCSYFCPLHLVWHHWTQWRQYYVFTIRQVPYWLSCSKRKQQTFNGRAGWSVAANGLELFCLFFFFFSEIRNKSAFSLQAKEFYEKILLFWWIIIHFRPCKSADFRSDVRPLRSEWSWLMIMQQHSGMRVLQDGGASW